MVALGALVGLWILGRELRRSGLPESGTDAAIAGVLGGMAGAKLLWVFEHLGEAPALDLLLSRGGMSWFGGFAGGVLAGVAVMRWKRLPVVAVLAAATPALAIGHAIGRIGCFLVGDDYGRPSHLPWAVAFPPRTTAWFDHVDAHLIGPDALRSLPVHPLQLYLAAWSVLVGFVLLRAARRKRYDGYRALLLLALLMGGW